MHTICHKVLGIRGFVTLLFETSMHLIFEILTDIYMCYLTMLSAAKTKQHH